MAEELGIFGAETGQEPARGQEPEQPPEAKVYTEEEVRALLQSESDRRVTQALRKQQKEYEKKLSLTKLDDDARAGAEKDIQIAELQEQLRAYRMEKVKSDLKTVLSARGLSAELADVIEVGEDVQAAQQRVEALDRLFKKSVQDEVKRRLSAATPKLGQTEPEGITPEQFRKMTIAQQAELYARNPELYKKLTS